MPTAPRSVEDDIMLDELGRRCLLLELMGRPPLVVLPPVSAAKIAKYLFGYCSSIFLSAAQAVIDSERLLILDR